MRIFFAVMNSRPVGLEKAKKCVWKWSACSIPGSGTAFWALLKVSFLSFAEWAGGGDISSPLGNSHPVFFQQSMSQVPPLPDNFCHPLLKSTVSL